MKSRLLSLVFGTVFIGAVYHGTEGQTQPITANMPTAQRIIYDRALQACAATNCKCVADHLLNYSVQTHSSLITFPDTIANVISCANAIHACMHEARATYISNV